MADGIYLGGVLNATPSQIIRFASDGIHIQKPNQLYLSAAQTNFTGPVYMNGKRVDETHEHGGVSPGGSNTGSVV
jgi:hypothetical protein